MNDVFQRTFSLFPADAIMTLESESQLALPVDETSPLRRELVDALPLVWDSRDLAKHKAPCLFVARKGHRFDGHTLVEEVLNQGHIVVAEADRLVELLVTGGRPTAWIEETLEHPYLIKVNDTENALRSLLVRITHLRPQTWTSVAVTGTNGKTSVTQIIGHFLEKLTQKAILRLGTLGVQIAGEHWDGAYPTMPDFPGFVTALSHAKERGASHVVFEATSHGLSENRMADWVVDAAIFTNFTQDHLDYHKTMTAYRACKAILFERHLKPSGTAILNTDDPEWRFFLESTKPGQPVMGYGSAANREAFLKGAGSPGRLVSFLEMLPTATSHYGIEGLWRYQPPRGDLAECEYGSPLLGSFQHANLTAAAASMLALGFPLTDLPGIAVEMPGIPGRLDLVQVEGSLGPTVLVDYAHAPDALEKTLLTLRSLVPPGGRLVSVFGCGGDRDSTKRPLMGRISEKIADVTFVTSDNPRTECPESIIDGIMAGMEHPEAVARETDRAKAICGAIFGARNNDIIVIAGKGHEDYQIVGTEKRHFSDHEVATDALRHRMSQGKKS